MCEQEEYTTACIINQYCDTTSIQLQCAFIRTNNSYFHTIETTNNRNNIATTEQCMVECVIQAKNKGKDNKKEVFSVTEKL